MVKPWRHHWAVVAVVAVVTGAGAGAGPAGAEASPPRSGTRASSPTAEAMPPGVSRKPLAAGQPINAPGQRLGLERIEIGPRAKTPGQASVGTVVMRAERGRIRFVVSRGSAVVTGRRGDSRTVEAPVELTLAAGDSVVVLPLSVYSSENRWRRPFVATVASLDALVVPGPVAPEAVESPPITLTTEITSASSSLANAEPSLRYGWNNLVGDATVGGETVRCNMLGNVSYVNGAGPFFGFVTYTWPDGSSLVTQMYGASVPQPDGGAVVTAMLAIIGGTGRYRAATGFGSFRGIRDAAVGAPVRSVFTLTPSTT
ncbi:MAG: hypothetical protein ACKOA9_05635 [Actinomycetota bacterium]